METENIKPEITETPDKALEVPAKKIVKEDAHGNTIYAQGKGIYLSMKDEAKPMRICTIDLDNKRIVVNREPFERCNKFYYRFNAQILEVAKKCDTLRIKCAEGTFDVPIAEMLLKGEKPNGENGLQTQIYYQIADMKLHPQKTTDNETNKQD